MMKNFIRYILIGVALLPLSTSADAALRPMGRASKLIEIAPGYSGTSVNTAIFRNNSLVTHDDTQYACFYDPEGYVTLAKRKLKSKEWEIKRTPYKGNVKDAHNVVTMGVDGNGYLHVAFDHHDNKLNYARSVAAGSLDLGNLQPMTGIEEENVTYPEFYSLPDGDLLFAYRSGASGEGNMALNRYDARSGQWNRVQSSLLDGEGNRSPYWQMYVDENGVIHLSWVWRESWFVETNHDLCYAKSPDGGMTWLRSDNSVYNLPITAENAEYAVKIPENSELINQTSITADRNSQPVIASYWRSQDSDVPQFRIVWHDGNTWQQREISSRTTPFTLSGGGTKMIPVSRPKVISDGPFIGVLYRDQERGGKVSLATTYNGPDGDWDVDDLTDFDVHAWEPTIDNQLWRARKKIHIFVQDTYQGDGEQALEKEPTTVYVLQY